MARLLLVDDAEALTNLFGRAVHDTLGHDITVIADLGDLDHHLDPAEPFDLALVDL